MLGVIKTDIRYEYLKDKMDCIVSKDLVDFIGIDSLLLPFAGIDSKYNIKGTSLNLIDILRVNGIESIYVGKANKELRELCLSKNIELFELLLDEEFVMENAHLTALGIVDYLCKSDKIINDFKVIICGFGYIGFSLAKILEAYGVDFSIYTTNPVEYKFVSMLGYKHNNFKDFSIIINTIPHNIDIDYSCLKNKRILDVASSPYGFDIEKINSINVRYEIYSSIPAKFCPNQAAEIIKKYIEKNRILIYN